MKAIDVDIGDNGMVEYTLAGDIEKHFMMEPGTGKIKLATPFDPNQQNIDYVLMVQAMDKGLCLCQGERTKFDRFESTHLFQSSSFFDLKYTEYVQMFQDLI